MTAPPVSMWDRRATEPGLHAVFTRRWSAAECADVDEAQWRLLRELTPWPAGRRVVDLGCGTGRLTRRLADAGAQAVGVDLSPGMLQRAERSGGGGRPRYVRATVGALPFPAAAFETVLAVFVLQHVLDDAEFRRALGEIARVAAPDGTVVTIDGIADRPDRPADSAITRVRTLAEYAPLRDRLRLEAVVPHTYVADRYTALVWRAA